MKVRIAACAALFGSLCVQAGEIVIVVPAETSARSEREPTRSERELGRTMDKARQYGGKGGAAPVVIEEGAPARPFDKTEQSIRDAQGYLRPGAETPATDGVTIILRSAPTSETEKLRQKARAQIAPSNPSRSATPCTNSVNTVGTIGEGAGAERSAHVVEKGNSAVNTQCK